MAVRSTRSGGKATPEAGDEAAEELVVGFGGLDARSEHPAAHRRGDGGVEPCAGSDGGGEVRQRLPAPAGVARLAERGVGVDGGGLEGDGAGLGVAREAPEGEAAAQIDGARPLLGDREDERGAQGREREIGPGGGEGEGGGVVGVAEPVADLEALPAGGQRGRGAVVDLELER